jgi:pimeloyl-ACP methyl ester carboxylesterase
MFVNAAVCVAICRRSVVGTVLVGLVAVLAASAAAADGSPRHAGRFAQAPPAISWTACGARQQCARVLVPVDWRRPAGPKIPLAVIRHVASHGEQRIGSLFLNPGGPGDSGVAAVKERGESLDALTAGRFDIVGWDVRGSGASAPVSCFTNSRDRLRFWNGVPVPSTSRGERRYLVKAMALARRCGARNGQLLRHMSTADTARDLDYLRGLVGDAQLTFLGESYGTMIGQTYANMFPGRVRAMALDGPSDTVAAAAGLSAVLADGLRDADRVFDAFLTACRTAGPARCALARHGPVARRVNRLLRRLRRNPIPAPSAKPPGRLTYGEALTVIKLQALPRPELWPQAARLLDAAASGDGSGLETIARLASSNQFRALFEQSVALICADSPARQSAREWPRVVRRLRATSRIGGRVFGWLQGAPCAAWPVRSAERYTGPWNAVTPNPILIVGTTLDPNTPFDNAQTAERRLGNAVLLTHDGFGHLSSADPSACVAQSLGGYLVNLAIPAHGTVCRSDRLPFDPQFGKPLS